MGLFNCVDYKMPCPTCSTEITDWQTKDGDLYMITVDPMTVSEFHAVCPKCKTWIQFDRKPVGTVQDNFTMSVEAGHLPEGMEKTEES